MTPLLSGFSVWDHSSSGGGGGLYWLSLPSRSHMGECMYRGRHTRISASFREPGEGVGSGNGTFPRYTSAISNPSSLASTQKSWPESLWDRKSPPTVLMDLQSWWAVSVPPKEMHIDLPVYGMQEHLYKVWFLKNEKTTQWILLLRAIQWRKALKNKCDLVHISYCIWHCAPPGCVLKAKWKVNVLKLFRTVQLETQKGLLELFQNMAGTMG